MLLITCANGTAGKHMVPHLAAQGFEIRVLDPHPAVEEYLAAGVKEVMAGSTTDPAVLARAMEGCSKVIACAPQDIAPGACSPYPVIDAAIKAGVQQFVLLSELVAHIDPLQQRNMQLGMELHLFSEALKAGLCYTILQPAFFHHHICVKTLLETGRLPNYNGPGIPLPFVDAEDVAEVSAKILIAPDAHNMAVYRLSGPSYLHALACAELFREISGRPIAVTQNRSLPMAEEDYAQPATGPWTQLRIDPGTSPARWGYPGNKTVLEFLLGRPAIDLGQYFRKELAALGCKCKA